MRSSFRLGIALATLFLGCADLLGIEDVTRNPGPGGGGSATSAGGGSEGSAGGGGDGERPAPSTPVPRLPVQDGAVGSMLVPDTRRPTFVWEPSASPAGESVEYTVELSEDPSFTALLATETTAATRWQPAADLEGSAEPPVGSRVYWRVRACSAGACSEPSAVRWISDGSTWDGAITISTATPSTTSSWARPITRSLGNSLAEPLTSSWAGRATA
ncbi:MULTISPECIES: hypothetical protein [Sorangium]|uniref:hypothetical protein n=1 Tax=Sorangium TaxID=39643 RepID=UPI0013EC910B|nr:MULTISPECIES: hypothetical protein [Sorangium]